MLIIWMFELIRTLNLRERELTWLRQQRRRRWWRRRRRSRRRRSAPRSAAKTGRGSSGPAPALGWALGAEQRAWSFPLHSSDGFGAGDSR